MTARERMVAGELYDALDPELVEARRHARALLAGFNISVGKRFYANVNCVFLDCAPIEIGAHVLLGPAVQLYTATHPLDSAERRRGLELAKPIVVGDDAWFGGGAIVLPGVTIGPRAVVGAGSVVTRDVLADERVAGNPARPIAH